VQSECTFARGSLTDQTEFTEDEFDSRYKVRTGAVLLSWSGSPETSIDTFVWAGADGCLNQHIFNVMFRSPKERSFVYSMLRHFKPTFVAIAKNTQTTGLGHVTDRDLKRLRTVMPSSRCLSAFNSVVDPVLQRAYECLCESQTLAALRDTLLPRLISGQLRVPGVAARNDGD
jgi:type I restriction enzyme S subunit